MKCNNCYWKGSYIGQWCSLFEIKPNSCKHYTPHCDKCNGLGEYTYHGKVYCSECILKKFDVEEYNITQYCVDGEIIGYNENFDEVIQNLSLDIKEL